MSAKQYYRDRETNELVVVYMDNYMGVPTDYKVKTPNGEFIRHVTKEFLDVYYEKYNFEMETIQPFKFPSFDDITKTYDVVNKPIHYANSKIEVIDYIQDKLTKDQFEGYCIGNVMKYVSRYQHKGGHEDLKKAVWYLDRLLGVEKHG